MTKHKDGYGDKTTSLRYELRRQRQAYGNPVKECSVSGVSVTSKLPPWESWIHRPFVPDAAYQAWGKK